MVAESGAVRGDGYTPQSRLEVEGFLTANHRGGGGGDRRRGHLGHMSRRCHLDHGQ
jgi:hypothetical protein